MQKKVINTVSSTSPIPAQENEKPAGAEVQEIREFFVPTDAQLRAKCRFWTQYADRAEDELPTTIQGVAEGAGTSTIRKWWYQSGFKDWFMNQEDSKEQIQYAYEKLLRSVQTSLMLEEPKAGQLLNLTKTVRLIEERLYPAHLSSGDDAEADVSKMSESELVAYLEERGISVREAPLEAEAEAVSGD